MGKHSVGFTHTDACLRAYLGRLDVLGHLVEVAVELGQLGLHHVVAGRPPAAHQDHRLLPDAVHAQTQLRQLLQHALSTHTHTHTHTQEECVLGLCSIHNMM